MKLFLIVCFALFNSIYISCQTIQNKQKDESPVINSDSPFISYSLNDKWHILNLSTIKNRQILKVVIPEKDNTLQICSAKDTLNFKFKINDTVRFITIVNNKDIIENTIVGVRKNAKFTDKYKIKNYDNMTVEIPKVSELANIIIAMTDVGLKDSNMVNFETNYHADVIKWFLKYKKEPIVKILDSVMNRSNHTDQYKLYYTLKMNSCVFFIDSNESFKRDSSILQIGYPAYLDIFEKNLPLLEKFAKITNFCSFYNLHKSYYDSVINIYKSRIDIKNLKEWLQSKFSTRINYVRVTFSPLVKGAHSCITFNDNNFTTSLLFVAPILPNPKLSSLKNQIENVRLIFTELDHEYNDPVSRKYEELINEAFKNKDEWADESKTGLYPSPLFIFDEYMTWAIFTLYSYDNFPKSELGWVMEYVGNFMQDVRGFKKYKSFNKALLQAYIKNGKAKSISELYPEIIKWCKNNNEL